MRKLAFAFMALAAIVMVGCKGKNDPQEKKGIEVKKIADYLYEYEADNYGTQAPAYVMSDNGRIPVFGCSAVRKGNFYGRNLDFNINEICEFIVRTKATATRKHASIGVVNPVFLTVTNDIVKNGLPDSVLNFIPWMTMDGINDAGLVCNINVVNMADLNTPHTHTKEGAPKIMAMNLIRALLDNCGSVAEAKTFIETNDITPIPTTWDGHIMIADPTTTVIVEFADGVQPIKYTEKTLEQEAIMTNFYVYQYEANKGTYPPHACGVERYEILKEGYSSVTTMEDMWELLKKVQYTQSYDVNVKPFWCSEFYDKIPDSIFLKKARTDWTKEEILKQPEPKKEVDAYEVYAKTGQYKLEDGLWFTTHNSTYDIANKTLWVTIREDYDKTHRYEFKLK